MEKNFRFLQLRQMNAMGVPPYMQPGWTMPEHWPVREPPMHKGGKNKGGKSALQLKIR